MSDDKIGKSIDHQVLAELAELINKSKLAEIEIEHDDWRIKVVASTPGHTFTRQVQDTQQGVNNEKTEPWLTKPPERNNDYGDNKLVEASDVKVINSPMVGTVYHSSSPDADPFVKPGDKITEGDTLCIIESMKMMNYIPSPISGQIKEILVSNGHPVEYDEPIIVMKPETQE